MLASLSDHTLRVWDAHSGAVGPKLEGHADRAHTLECHPLCPRLAMSAGYDGLTIVWDLLEGTPLAKCALFSMVCSKFLEAHEGLPA